MKKLALKAAIPNPLLEPFALLIGEWETVGNHPYLPGIVLPAGRDLCADFVCKLIPAI